MITSVYQQNSVGVCTFVLEGIATHLYTDTYEVKKYQFVDYAGDKSFQQEEYQTFDENIMQFKSKQVASLDGSPSYCWYDKVYLPTFTALLVMLPFFGTLPPAVTRHIQYYRMI